MPDRRSDLVDLFVRNLDQIELPPRDRWRPTSRKGSYFMKTSRYVLYAGAVAAVLVAALLVGNGLRDRNVQVAASPTPISATNTPTQSASPSPTRSPSPTLAPGTFESSALGYRVRPPDGYRRYATLIVPGPDGVGVDFFTQRTDAQERDMCIRQKGSDLPPPETALDLQIRVVSNAAGTSAVDYAGAPNRRIAFTTIQATTVNGYEAAKIVHQQSGDTSWYVIRANDRIYEISPGQDEQPSALPKGWLDQIVATFSAITPDASPAAVDTRTRC
jgi:hypothetical protein